MNTLRLKVDNSRANRRGLNLTVRRWAEKYQPPLPRDLLLEDDSGRVAGAVIVGEKQMRFADIPEGALVYEHDVCDRDKAGLLASMQRYYPGFEETDRVVLIWYWCGA